jgi:Na+/H+ antiporter NhaD/arsenite permease-like protein
VQGTESTGPDGGDLTAVLEMFVSLWPALLALFISHGYSFAVNFLGQQEYAGRSLKEQMTEPYKRIIFMHLVLIFGGGLSMILGNVTVVLLLVIAIKIWLDVRAHVREHQPEEA